MNGPQMLSNVLRHQRLGDWDEARLRQEKAAAFTQWGRELLKARQPNAAADCFDFAAREITRANQIKVAPLPPGGAMAPSFSLHAAPTARTGCGPLAGSAVIPASVRPGVFSNNVGELMAAARLPNPKSGGSTPPAGASQVPPGSRPGNGMAATSGEVATRQGWRNSRLAGVEGVPSGIPASQELVEGEK